MKSIRDYSNSNYDKDGFEIHNIFTEEELNNIRVDFYNRMLLQAYKIGIKDVFHSQSMAQT